MRVRGPRLSKETIISEFLNGAPTHHVTAEKTVMADQRFWVKVGWGRKQPNGEIVQFLPIPSGANRQKVIPITADNAHLDTGDMIEDDIFG